VGERRWLGPAIAAVVVALAVLVGVLAPPGSISYLATAWALHGAAAAAFLCAMGAAGFAFRRSDDPRQLAVGIGAGVVGTQLLIGSIWRFEPVAYLTLTGWLGAGIAFLGSLPWSDRRGKAPIDARRTIALAAVLLAVTDALVIAFAPAPTVELANGVVSLNMPLLGTAGAVVAAVLLVVSAIREWSRLGIDHAIAGAAFAVGSAVPIAYLLVDRNVAGERPYGLLQVAPIASAALLFASLGWFQRVEVSRMRRETDRAAEITGGRAEIASMVAHEIRGPVTTIKGLAQTSERHYDRLPEADRREFLVLIEQESERLLRIADQTSTALKVDAGTLRYELEPNDLADVVGAAVERAAIGDHPVAPELEPGVGVSIDSVRLGEAVRQVVENAAAFSPSGEPIAVRAYRSGATAVVEVVDRGPGIPPERRELAFTKFPGFRPAGYEEVPGTGLGLFIARAHVREQGGSITIDPPCSRSEERRVGKECRSRWSPYH